MKDSLAPAANLSKLAAMRVPQNIPFEVHLYEGAGHRFDVTRPGNQSYDPGMVPREHDPVASSSAFKAIGAFLDRQEITANACALD